MNTNRTLRAFALGLALLLATASTTSCDPVSRDWHWTLGDTHGVIIETTAGRASLGVYRVPTNALNYVLDHAGTNKVQDILWDYGEPPTIKKTFTYRGVSVTIAFGTVSKIAKALAKSVIYGDDGDLKSALNDAADHDACLAVTLISYGRPDSNWTKKNTGCKDGSIT